MCGRYSITTPVEALRRLFRLSGPIPNLPPRYNVAPTQLVPIVRRARGDGERWDKAPDGAPVESCTIVATSANQLLRPLHDRMPVILAPDDYAAWLGEDAAHGAAELLRRYPSEEMRAFRVSTAVNSVRNDGPGCAALI